jgi:diguanylate cyclase (GGDEF)-like protein/PAS domain S-box-containing protein
MDDRDRPWGFLSLKWQALLLTSLVLVAVTAAFTILDYMQLRTQFEEHRLAVNTQYGRQIHALMERFSKHLESVSSLVASLPETKALISSGAEPENTGETKPGDAAASQAKASAEFMHLVSTSLEMNLGIEQAAIYSANAKQLVEQNLTNDETTLRQINVAVHRAMEQEEPQQVYQCAETCLLFSIAPVLDKRVGHSVGALALGLPAAYIVEDLQRVSGTDIGLVLRQEAAQPNPQENWLLPWKSKVIALSKNDHARNLDLLHKVADTKRPLGRGAAPIQIELNARQFEVGFVGLPLFEPAAASAVFITDISQELKDIQRSAWRNVGLGLLGLLLSESLLLAALWTPISRLRRAADTLPKLALSAYEEVRRTLKIKSRSKIRDEVDVLDDTAVALSHQLEALDAVVSRRTADLSERMEELAQERDFINHMLNTAQAIIITQNSRNEILTLNRHGEQLTGYTEHELHGKPFVSLLLEDSTGPALVTRLRELDSGKRQHLEEEWDVRCKDGSSLNIVWLHSRLNKNFREGPTTLSIGMDITARKRAEVRLAWLADHDPLTRLFNRRRFQEELKEAIAAAKRFERGGALLFFDLDQFKFVNDISGHRVGDLLLERLGESLPRVLREVDVLGRLGGDEFAAVLPQSNAEEAIQVARKILAHIQGSEFRARGRIHKVSASIGIALFPEHGNNVRDLLANADLAMYHVKETGRGGWHMFSSEDQSRQLIHERALWKERVERAIEERRLLLYVQPIVYTSDQRVSHYEVLLRMKEEDGGIIHPSQFVQVAERSGLIHSIDKMVLATAINYQAALRNRGETVTFSINLSAHAFTDPELLPHLQRLLKETQLDPSQVILEMTETAAVGDLAAAKRLLEEIRKLGCRFALDDFGTGFSSFFYMRELPMEFVKIDGSFIHALAERPEDQALVKAISEIARTFGKTTVAEQVEDQQTLDLLKEFHIDMAQGYYTGRPVPVTEIFGGSEIVAKQM